MRRGILGLSGIIWVLLLVQLNSPTDVAVRDDSEPANATISVEQEGAVWYCPAGDIQTDEVVTHQIIISNVGEAPVEANVVGFGETADDSKSLDVEVPADSLEILDSTKVGDGLGGFMVEIFVGDATVEHRLSSATHLETSTCTTGASSTWNFPIVDTRLGNSAGLWILNPFPTDASIDVVAAVADGARVPKGLAGFVIPARSSRYVELNEFLERREQFAFTMETRAGRVIAELVQSSDESLLESEQTKEVRDGMSMYMGVPQASSQWVFADSFAGANTIEKLVVYNPGAETESIEVSVVPIGLEDVPSPEPFVVELTASRFAEIDLSAESRLPSEGIRSIRVRSFDEDGEAGGGVVVGLSHEIIGSGGDATAATRPSVESGKAISTGSSLAAKSWIVGMVTSARVSESVVSIANPSAEKSATFALSVVIEGERLNAGEEFVVGPLSSITVDLSQLLADAAGSLVIVSDEPLIAEGRSTSSKQNELTALRGIVVDPGVSVSSVE